MMNEQILQPMVGMMALTAIVLIVMYAKRIPAMRKVGKPAQAYTTPDKGLQMLPEEVSYAAHNFKNLFELPVIFYALCLYLFVTQSAQQADVIAAWIFLVFRVIHSAIHCTVNIVMLRFLAYTMATFALLFMLVRAVWGAFL
jgi:hypothetical protein